KRELIVPNKEFITSRVLNWTLSDSMNRLLLSIGIAYGSDAGEAMRLIAQAADENEYLLKDPKPVVSFEAFGDSALLLELRCYLGSFDFRLTAK
ncbi:MAG: mechanosensitive ion channel, partial [Phycisphaerae bacterium]|nr:mechanosensitive ion channel [Phycisphaerae bacterium]